MSFNQLANELLICIAESIDSDRDINALAQTCHRVYHVTNDILYQHHVLIGGGVALRWAVENGRTETARKLLRKWPEGKSVDRPGGVSIPSLRLLDSVHGWYKVPECTTLTHAARYGYMEIAKMLLEKGAVIKRRIATSKDPLCTAIESCYDSLDMIKLLLDSGAMVTGNHYDPLSSIMRPRDERRRPGPSGVTDEDIARLLLERGADVNACETKALRVAVMSNNLGMAKLLLDHGANVNVLQEKQILDALAQGHTVMATLLTSYGACIDVSHGNSLEGNLQPQALNWRVIGV